MADRSRDSDWLFPENWQQTWHPSAKQVAVARVDLKVGLKSTINTVEEEDKNNFPELCLVHLSKLMAKEKRQSY